MASTDNNGKRDSRGRTEEQFLAEYDVTKYFRPSVTVDALLYVRQPKGIKLLLIRRGGHPFIGEWAFPGGFVEKDEPCEVAAPRELFEETGITGVPLRQLVAASTPDRDPRWRNITVVFCGEVDRALEAKGGDDAREAVWFDVTASVCGNEYRVTLVGADGSRLNSVLDVKRDSFGEVDINATKITERGGLAFDHAKIILYLLEKIGGRI